MQRSGLPRTVDLVLFSLAFVLVTGAIAGGRFRSARATASPSATAEKARPEPAVAPILRAASPVPPAFRLGSGFGTRRGRRTGKPTFHAGADFPAPEGTPVFAARAGRVVRVLLDAAREPGFRGYGNAVLLHHPQDDSWTLYAHLAEPTARAGMQVLAGATIGRVGATSNGRFAGMGSHLHFEVRRRCADGRPPFPGPYRVNNVDPRRWLAARGVVFGADGALASRSP